MKPRLNIYLDDVTAAQLALISKRPGTNKSRIVNDALDKFFNPEKDQELSQALIRRLDRMSRSLERLDRNQSIALESLALFIRYFLTITPPLPESDQASAHALGLERFEVFIAQVGRRLAQDKNLASDVLEALSASEPDLFATNPDGQRRTTSRPADGKAPSEQSDETLPPLRPVVIEDDDEEFADDFLEDLELDDLELGEFFEEEDADE